MAPSLAALICFPQSIFTLPVFLSLYQSKLYWATKKPRRQEYASYIAHLESKKQILTRTVKKRKYLDHVFLMEIEARQLLVLH